MTSALAQSETRIARPLKVLVPLIKEDIALGNEVSRLAGLPYYRAAGEKFIEAKDQLQHGEFMPWVQRNFDISISTANRWMALARELRHENARSRAISSLQDFVEPEHRPRISVPAYHEVQRTVEKVDLETLNLKREELKRQDERDAQRQLALQLIDIGYKVLARELHPDKGGSREAMARLNAVRDRLKQNA